MENMRVSVETRPDREEGSDRRRADFELLFQEQAPRIARALFAYTGDREIASDATAEAFSQALASRTPIRTPSNWVWSVAFRVAASELQRVRLNDPLMESPYQIDEPHWQLLSALAFLSPNQRKALILRHYAGYTTREVAQMMGCLPATVRVHLSKGRRRLVRLLEEADDG